MADFHELGPDMQDARTLARGAGVALPGRVIGRAMAVLTQILLARLLGPAIFGLYSVGYALLRLGELILPLGMDQGVVRFGAYGQGADPEPPPGVLSSVYWLGGAWFCWRPTWRRLPSMIPACGAY